MPSERLVAWAGEDSVEGTYRGPDRLSHVLNSREPLVIDGARRSPLAKQGSSEDVGSLDLDPFELDLVMLRLETDPSPEESIAHRVRKLRYGVHIEADEFAVEGILHVFPGRHPENALAETRDLFLVLTDARADRGDATLSSDAQGAILVNRYRIRSITVGGPGDDTG